MSNPLPLPTNGSAQRGSAPNSIDPSRYPGLEDLRRHCSRDGVALIDRVYRDALALHKRALDAEVELSLFVDVGEPASTFAPKKPVPTLPVRAVEPAGEDLL